MESENEEYDLPFDGEEEDIDGEGNDSLSGNWLFQKLLIPFFYSYFIQKQMKRAKTKKTKAKKRAIRCYNNIISQTQSKIRVFSYFFYFKETRFLFF